MQFARFVRGRSSAREVADSYTRYYTMRMEVARQQEQGGAPVRHVLSHQAYMFNELAASVYPLLNREDNVPEELSDSVTLLFGKDHLLRSTAPDNGAEKAPESPQDASETSEGATAFSEGETLRQDSAKGNE